MMRHMSSIEKNGYWKLHVYENYPAPSSEYMNFPDANGKEIVSIVCIITIRMRSSVYK